MEDESYSNDAFARTLLFYYLYLRAKLTVNDLEKIARKYKSNSSEKLLNDLQTKYSYFPIPTKVSREELSRIISNYNVPSSFIERISITWEDGTTYDSLSDVYSLKFDPLHALTNEKIIAATTSWPVAPPVDNMAKAKLLYLEEIVSEDGQTILRPLRRRAVDQFFLKKDDNSSRGDPAENIVSKPLHQHIFDAIAEYSMKQDVNSSSNSNSNSSSVLSSSVASPLQLLYRLMKTNSRARVILRRTAGVRGSVEAYVKAFDRHFNLLLADVDEEYILNKQKIKKMKLGHFVNKANIIKRYLPQLLLRGDNVILVFEASRISSVLPPSSSASSSSSSSSSSSTSVQYKKKP